MKTAGKASRLAASVDFAGEELTYVTIDVLDKAGPRELETLRQVFSILGRWHREKAADSPEEESSSGSS